MKKLVLFWALFALGSVYAAKLPFRSGWVLNAEITSRPVAIKNFIPELYPDLPQQKVYCAVTIVLDSGRKLALGDYQLEHFGRRLPCVGIRSGNGQFEAIDYTIEPIPGQKYTMLFIMDGNRVNCQKNTFLLLCSTAKPGTYETKLRCTGCGQKALRSASAIPDNGTFKVPKRRQ